MCGLTGIIAASESDVESFLEVSSRLQKHRGPDIQQKRTFSIGDKTLGFSHQRLSILDLSDAGVQPMSDLLDYSCLVNNGEVYNYQEIKTSLQQASYRSSSDTEVVLNALLELGVEKSLNMFNGMWAIAWFDRRVNKLYLCRDRVGVKPLYYHLNNGKLYFSSEVKSILQATGDKFSLNYQAVGEYIYQSQQDTTDNSFFSEIKSVPAGHYATIDLGKDILDISFTKYWDVSDAEPYIGDDLEVHVKKLFTDAVKLRLRSDVPVGVTLSGGLDSSAIAVTMKSILGSADNLNIISAVAPDSKLDESEFIDEMVNHLGASVHKVKMDWGADEALELLRKVTWYNDSPVGSFSNIAHYLMMKEAHKLGITVILSGQGADELLCGYKKYLGFYLQWLVRNKLYFKAFKIFNDFLFNGTVISQFNLKEAKRYLPKFIVKSDIDIGGEKLKRRFSPLQLSIKPGQTVQARQAEDLERFSVPFLTHYEDRMSMAWSREIRLPFLDYRLMELFVICQLIKS